MHQTPSLDYNEVLRNSPESGIEQTQQK
jgi:hypothetical protein